MWVTVRWRAVRSMNPDVFEFANDCVALKIPDIFALHRLCLSVMRDMCRGHREYVEREFAVMLEDASEVADPNCWFVGSSEEERGDAAKYGSMKGFAEIGDMLHDSVKP